MVQVSTFDGGLATRVDPSLLQLNQAVRLVNIDPDSAVLKPLPNPNYVDDSATPNIRNFNGSWIDFPNPVDAVEWDGKLFYTDGVQPSVRDKDGNTHKLGISAPEDGIISVVSTIPVYPEPIFTESGGAKEATLQWVYLIYRIYGRIVYGKTHIVPISKESLTVSFTDFGDYTIQVFAYNDSAMEFQTNNTFVIPYNPVGVSGQLEEERRDIGYVITKYNENTGFESAPSAIRYKSCAIDWLNNVAWETEEGDDFTHYKLYRLGYNTTKFALVGTVRKGTINGNADSSGATVISDTSLAEPTVLGLSNVKQLETLDAIPADKKMHSLVEVIGVLVGIVGDEVRYSLPTRPSSWPPTNSIKLREPGTGLLVIPSGILVFTANLTYFLTGTSVNDFRLSLISDTQGCKSHKSCKLVRNTPVWVSNDGICTLRNNYVSVLSRQLLGYRDINPIDATVADEQYYILEAKPEGDEPAKILVADFRAGLRFYEMTAEALSLESHGGKAYMSRFDGGTHIVNTLGTDDDMIYYSPTFIDGNHTTTKSYNKVFIRYKGVFTVKVFIDNKLTLTRELDGDDMDETAIDSNKDRGTSCRFEITGKGVIYSLSARPSGDRVG